MAENPQEFKIMITPEAFSILNAFGFELLGIDKKQRANLIYLAKIATQDVVISLPQDACKEELLEAIVASGRAQNREKVREAHQRWLDTFKG